MFFKPFLTILFLGVFLNSYSQTDTTFWFAAPEVSSNDGFDRPIIFRITSVSQPCTVTISQPANGGLPTQVISLAANATESVDLTNWIDNIECRPGDVVQNRGILIQSTEKITVYYDVNYTTYNPELFVLKGRNALGKNFFISSQFMANNWLDYSPIPYSSFNIIATEDNTSVTILPTADIIGHTAGSSFTITLNKGQTYAAITTHQESFNHLQGSVVTSTKNVAITLADDLLNPPAYGLCRDLIGDQTIPTDIAGTEYIAVQGSLFSPFDKVYITAINNNTQVSKDGFVVATINAGQTQEIGFSGTSTYIKTSSPAYAYHVSGIGCELGAAILPPIKCTGSSKVSIVRGTVNSFYLTLLVRSGNQGNFRLNGSSSIITAGAFSFVPGTANQWMSAKALLSLSDVPFGSVLNVSNTSGLFHLGVLQGTTNDGASYGFFSDFQKVSADASTPFPTLCPGNSINLLADTLVSASYSWAGPNSFSSNLQSPVVPTATSSNSGRYFLTVNVPGCAIAQDSVDVTVTGGAVLKTIKDTSVCKGDTIVLLCTGGFSNYQWTPSNVVTNSSVQSPVFPAVSSQTVFVTASDNDGCVGKDTLVITVKPAAIIKTISDTVVCGSKQITLTTTGAVNYSWSPSIFLSDASSANPVFDGISDQVYVVSGTAANGCSARDTVNVTVHALPIVKTLRDTSKCSKDFLVLTSTSGLSTYSWSPGTAVSDSSISSPVFTASNSQVLVLTATDNSNCSASDTISITFKQSPLVKTIDDTTICNNLSIILTTTGANTYSWSPANFLSNAVSAAPNFNGTSNAMYVVSGTGANGCVSKDTINIYVRQPVVFHTSQDKAVCEGKSVLLDGNNGTGVAYSWSPVSSLSNPGIINPIASPASNTVYQLLVTDTFCRKDTMFTIQVTVTPSPVAAVSKSNDVSCAVSSAQLNASGGSEYLWSPTNGLSDAAIANPVASPSKDQTYLVIVKNTLGCEDTASVNVLFIGAGLQQVFIPNAFTPDGNTTNDCFGLKNVSAVQEFHMEIYDRWGTLVYYSNDAFKCWDGTYKGVKAIAGTYTYLLKIKGLCVRSQERKGTVVLIR